jgi:hypothetical protein
VDWPALSVTSGRSGDIVGGLNTEPILQQGIEIAAQTVLPIA